MWLLKLDIRSQSLRGKVPAFIQYNYFTKNNFLRRAEDYVDMWPRSFAVGIFGAQLADVHFNRLRNLLLDFELVSGAKVIFCFSFSIYTMTFMPTGYDSLRRKFHTEPTFITVEVK